MEFFNKAKAVRLQSHHNKYLFADDDEETVLQSRNGSSRKARWTVELVEGKSHVIRLKGYHGKYLMASDKHFLLGTAGKKVLQAGSSVSKNNDNSIEWEPMTEGFRVKLRTRGGKFLRANGGTPPWRNSITHDRPYRTATQDLVLWGVDIVDIVEDYSEPGNTLPTSNVSSISEDFVASESSAIGTPPSRVSKGFGFANRIEE